MHELAALGLSTAAEDAYRALVAEGPLTVTEVARRFPSGTSGTSDRSGPSDRSGRDVLAGAITSLGAAGLTTVDDAGRVVAVSPDVALDALVAGRAAALTKARAAIAGLTEFGRTRAAGPDPGRVVEEVIGTAAVADRTTQLCLLATTEVRRIDAGSEPPPRLAPGTGYRAVLAGDQGIVPAASVRVVDTVPVRLLLCDERFALVRSRRPARADGQDVQRALLIRGGALIRALAALFETVWDSAVPGSVELVAPDRPPDDDRQLLALLATGATDESIARRLGTSTRTVRRRVRDLMHRVGVTTRLRLGQEAARRGWV